MKVIYNKFIPFKGFKAINLFGFVFVRKGQRVFDSTLNREAIHTAQMEELLYVPFYIAYVGEWLFRLIQGPFIRSKGVQVKKSAYDRISFEIEAYKHAHNDQYLKTRKRFAQWRKQS